MVVRCPRLRHRPDAPPHEGDRAVPLLRLPRCRPPPSCPGCDFSGIRYCGLGTQRLEAEVRARFPDGALPADGHRHHARRAAATSGPWPTSAPARCRILLGTQMIAKGLDFPNVTLVGVINADTALHLPDFRAAERTFQLVTQVAGRTGRGPKGGRVLVQTFSPDHPAIRAAVRHDYAAFAAGELPMRETLRYPPFASMVRLVIRGPVETVTAEFALELAERLKAASGGPAGRARASWGPPRPLSPGSGASTVSRSRCKSHDGDKLRAAVRQATLDVPAARRRPVDRRRRSGGDALN